MSKTLIWGIVTNSEVRVSQKGKNYGSIALSTSFKTKDGQIKTLTNYVSVLDEYNLELMKQQLVGIGDHLVIDCNISANTYENKNGETVATINYIANLINNLDIATRYNMLGAAQQQVANINPQAVYTAPVNTTPVVTPQVNPNVNQMPQATTRPVYNSQPQAAYTAPVNTTPQNNNVSQPTTPGNTNPWDLEF